MTPSTQLTQTKMYDTVHNTHKQIQTLENHWPNNDTELNKANFSTLEVIILDLLAT